MRTGKPIIVFDFDGVLADSFDILYQMVSAAFTSFGLSLAPDQYRDFYRENVKNAERKILGSGKKFQKFQKQLEARRAVYDKKVKLFPFVPDFVRDLERMANISIVSSTPANTIRQKLDEYKLSHLFGVILGANAEFSKRQKLDQAISTFGGNPEKVLFVSDTVGDINEGREAGLETIAVTWGFHDRVLLAKAQPTFLIDTHREFMDKFPA